MIEITGDLFVPESYRCADGSPGLGVHPDAICISTNGFVKKSGEAVMGRGCAQEAKKRWPGIEYELGRCIRQRGNIAHRIASPTNSQWPIPYTIVSFPVKPKKFYPTADRSNVVRHQRDRMRAGEPAPGWAAVADLELIKQSALDLVSMADTMGWSHIVLPRPGCGHGELSWEDQVKPVLEEILDDRFSVITWR
jgi:hypothetical protein